MFQTVELEEEEEEEKQYGCLIEPLEVHEGTIGLRGEEN